MKNIFHILGIFIVALSTISATNAQSLTATTSTSTIEKVGVAKTNKEKIEDLLKTDFFLDKDEFDTKKLSYFEAKPNKYLIEMELYGFLLKPTVREDGYIYLEDQYCKFNSDSSWLFHNQIQVKVGSKIYTSKKVNTLSENYQKKVYDKYHCERITYLNNSDNGILKAIALSGDKEVSIRFSSKDSQDDFTLDALNKELIVKAYQLSQLIKISQKKNK